MRTDRSNRDSQTDQGRKQGLKFRWKGKGNGHGDHILLTTNDPNNWYGYCTRTRLHFNPDFKVRPGRIEVPKKLLRWARPYTGATLLEPHAKERVFADNKTWPWERWVALSERLQSRLIQADYGKPVLPGVEGVKSPDFAHLAALVAVSGLVVTTEGGVHHAAGALGKPAVVIFGGFSDPAVMGYDFHENIAEPSPECLGQRQSHPACREAMERITVDRVYEAICETLSSSLARRVPERAG